MVAQQGTLDRSGVIAYVGQNAAAYGLDPAAVLAVANHEGLNTAPGSTWNLTQQFGELGFNFGPPSWYSLGAGGDVLKMQGSNAPNWAWTPEGLNYWLSQVAQSASGLTGGAAIQAIVHGFERPLARLEGGEIQNASADYSGFQQMLQGIGVGSEITSGTTTPTQSGVTGDTGAQTGAQVAATSGSNPQQTNLNLSDSIGHSIMQFLLVLIGIALLLGGIYLIGSQK